MKARDVMTTPVVTVAPDASLLEAGELMVKHDISALPVVDKQGRLVGLVTERDFLRPAAPAAGRQRPRWLQVLTGQAKDGFRHPAERKVADVMTADPITVTEDTTLDKAIALMDRHSFHRLPVMRGSTLVGIISRADLLRALVQSLHKASTLSKQYADIRARMTALERESWLHRTRP